MASKRDRVDWKGYMPAIVTPFARDHSLDFAALGTMLDWLHGEGMHGLVVAGTTGEWASMTGDERVALFSAAGAQMAGKLPLIAGCSALRIDESVAFANHAATCGYEGVLITPPPYLQPRDDEIVSFYSAIAERISLPICVYNWPPGTNVDMSVELLTRLAEIDRVVAVKQSTGNLQSFIKTVFELGDRIRVFGYAMDELSLTLLQARGGDGTLGSGGVLGHLQPDFYNHIWAGEIDKARACGRADRIILESWCNADLTGKFGSGPAIMKAALNARGVPGGHVRPPLLDLTGDDAQTIADTLRSVGVL